MDFDDCVLDALTEETAAAISQWEYEKPYDRYNFKDYPNGYLLHKETWGVEQFCLKKNHLILGYVSCQFDGRILWVGWSLSPYFCGQGNGYLFIEKCVEEIRKIKNYYDMIYLRVAASNKRAIKAYQKAGFHYIETIKDEVAYSNRIEDFWVMGKDA